MTTSEILNLTQATKPVDKVLIYRNDGNTLQRCKSSMVAVLGGISEHFKTKTHYLKGGICEEWHWQYQGERYKLVNLMAEGCNDIWVIKELNTMENKTLIEIKEDFKKQVLEFATTYKGEKLTPNHSLLSVEFYRIAMEEVFGKPVAYSVRTPKGSDVGFHGTGMERQWTFAHKDCECILTFLGTFTRNESIYITKELD